MTPHQPEDADLLAARERIGAALCAEANLSGNLESADLDQMAVEIFCGARLASERGKILAFAYHETFDRPWISVDELGPYAEILRRSPPDRVVEECHVLLRPITHPTGGRRDRRGRIESILAEVMDLQEVASLTDAGAGDLAARVARVRQRIRRYRELSDRAVLVTPFTIRDVKPRGTKKVKVRLRRPKRKRN
jgi:hypothetical protein